MRKHKLSLFLAVMAVLLLAIPAGARGADWPDIIPLPTGFQPEGIAVGRGHTFYTGSLVDGRILRGDLRTGETEELVAGQEGMFSVGMAYDPCHNALFVAGGPTGLARVFDADSGELLRTYQLAAAGSFINDVIVTREAAYFTVSSQAVLYRIPLDPGGELPDDDAAAGSVEEIPLTGDWVQIPNAFNANGIEAVNGGEWLIVVNSTAGDLFRVDPATGAASLIKLGAPGMVTNGDGLLLRGTRLYVVRNRLNEIAVVKLAGDLETGEVVDSITSPDFAVPTTLARFGNSLYAVNAKFGSEAPETLPYEVVRVPTK